jgi:hypothetical protein
MKIPTEILGNNKIRDAAICRAWAVENLSCEEIAPKFNLTASRIQQIIYKNRALVKIDRDWENTKQIQRTLIRIRKAEVSKKDVHDWETLLDSKIESKRGDRGGNGGVQVIIVRPEKQAVQIQSETSGEHGRRISIN